MAESTTVEESKCESKSNEEILHLIEAVQENGGRRNRSFSMSFKREAIAFAEDTTNLAAARKFKVDTKRIREWRQNKQLIIKACEEGVEKTRLKGAGRKVAHRAMEEELVRWYKEQKSSSIVVTRRLMMEKAKELHNEMCEETQKKRFLASPGWLQKFQQRYGLSFREKKVYHAESPGTVSMVLFQDIPHVHTQE